MKKKPKYFCSKCGVECDLTRISHGFDNKTGKEFIEWRATCSKLERYWFSNNGHTSDEFAGGDCNSDRGEYVSI